MYRLALQGGASFYVAPRAHIPSGDGGVLLACNARSASPDYACMNLESDIFVYLPGGKVGSVLAADPVQCLQLTEPANSVIARLVPGSQKKKLFFNKVSRAMFFIICFLT